MRTIQVVRGAALRRVAIGEVRRVRSVGDALRLAETVLLAGGQRQARRNAWASVCENRQYAADREHSAAPVRRGA
ncbi:hypothetical protein CFP65_1980 [Kitasatospora sp. MMS16-BH015]|uniref:hypothetical protein n=1 Tax=Kitasatospora sp. MMS16-BH015 TaxID=2018025 RepID=UPI000CA19F74|nr:hypothetical protein [Kitasatospora sp. MMS16-BH015]AUG76846.1 hypothetical protein CFP65_1980 [Kitasatospora sp. MMS16-BH015]